MSAINVSPEKLREYAIKINEISENIAASSDTIESGANKVVDVWKDNNGSTFSGIFESDIKPKINQLKENINEIIDTLNRVADSYQRQIDEDKSKVNNIEI